MPITPGPGTQGPILDASIKELEAQLAALPSTGKGAAHITFAHDGARMDFATRWNTHVSSSAYWQKPRKGAASWGARTTIEW